MGKISAIFSPPKPKALPAPVIPQPIPPKPVPTVENKAKDIDAAQQEDKKRLRAQRGRASTILTSGKGILGDDTTTGLATKKLLGG